MRACDNPTIIYRLNELETLQTMFRVNNCDNRKLPLNVHNAQSDAELVIRDYLLYLVLYESLTRQTC